MATRFLSVALALCCARMCAAQLSTFQVYHLVDRPIPVRIEQAVPPQPSTSPDTPAPPAPDLELELIRPADPGAPGTTLSRVPVVAGLVDLSTLFPILWTRQSPEQPPELLCVQLVSGGRRLGTPLVLQPLLTPSRATITDPRGLSVRFTPPAKITYSGLRIYTDQRVLLDTTAGPITIALRPDSAPNTAWHFRHLVEGGFYATTTFHRVIATTASGSPFMIQGGDPLGTGIGGPGFAIALEPSTLRHEFGVVSMARLTQPDTAGSQFFISLSRPAAAALDGAYAAFAQVVSGGDTVRAIAASPVDPKDKPLEPIVIKSASLVPAPPIGDGPPPEREPAPLSR
ncbi:MAG: peptidylprolyl isomerase [Phycisphaerales bacterium]